NLARFWESSAAVGCPRRSLRSCDTGGWLRWQWWQVQKPDAAATVTGDDGARGDRDCEVGGIATMGEAAGAGVELPDLERSVLRRRDHVPAIRRRRARGHPVGVALQRGHRALARELPDLERSVGRRRDHMSAVRRNRARRHPGRVALQRGYRAPG